MVAQQLEPVGILGRGDELAVRLVEHDEQIARHPVEEAFGGGAPDGGAGRVVRIAHEHDTRAVGDGVGHGVEIVALVDQRDLHHRRAELLGEHRVRLERRPGEQHFVAGIAGGGHGHAAQLHRAVGEQDLVGRHRAVGAQGFTQRGGAVVGIAVGAAGRGFDRLERRRQRSERAPRSTPA